MVMGLTVPAMATGPESSSDSNMMLKSIMANKSFWNDLQAEAPVYGLISIDNIDTCDDDFVTFSSSELLNTYEENEMTVQEYRSDAAGIYYTGADDVIAPIDPGSVCSPASSIDEGPAVDKKSTVRIYSTIYYKKSTDNAGRTFVELTRVEGKYERIGVMSPTINQTVTLGQTGWAVGGYKTQYEDYSMTAAFTSWFKLPPKTWVPILDEPATTTAIGATYVIKLSMADGSNWRVELNNNIY